MKQFFYHKKKQPTGKLQTRPWQKKTLPQKKEFNQQTSKAYQLATITFRLNEIINYS